MTGSYWDTGVRPYTLYFDELFMTTFDLLAWLETRHHNGKKHFDRYLHVPGLPWYHRRVGPRLLLNVGLG